MRERFLTGLLNYEVKIDYVSFLDNSIGTIPKKETKYLKHQFSFD